MEEKTAMKDSNGNPVFVRKDGSYSYKFPEENIVSRNTTITYDYTVYFFVWNNGDYEEFSYNCNDRQKALDFATNVYGGKIEFSNISGEVYDVEIHNN